LQLNNKQHQFANIKALPLMGPALHLLAPLSTLQWPHVKPFIDLGNVMKCMHVILGGKMGGLVGIS